MNVFQTNIETHANKTLISLHYAVFPCNKPGTIAQFVAGNLYTISKISKRNKTNSDKIPLVAEGTAGDSPNATKVLHRAYHVRITCIRMAYSIDHPADHEVVTCSENSRPWRMRALWLWLLFGQVRGTLSDFFFLLLFILFSNYTIFPDNRSP